MRQNVKNKMERKITVLGSYEQLTAEMQCNNVPTGKEKYLSRASVFNLMWGVCANSANEEKLRVENIYEMILVKQHWEITVDNNIKLTEIKLGPFSNTYKITVRQKIHIQVLYTLQRLEFTTQEKIHSLGNKLNTCHVKSQFRTCL